MNSNNRTITTLAHEVFHVLENRVAQFGGQDHYPYTGEVALPDERVNLMVKGSSAINEKKANGPYAKEIWSVRLTQDQEENSYTAAQGGDPTKSKLLS